MTVTPADIDELLEVADQTEAALIARLLAESWADGVAQGP